MIGKTDSGPSLAEQDTPAARCGRLEYNATLVDLLRVHEELALFRVRPDGGVPDFKAGQYTTLGLCSCEPCCEGVSVPPLAPPHDFIKRAYSFSSPMLMGELVRPADCGFAEFYICLVRPPAGAIPALTPRLFALEPGSRLYFGPRPKGTYTLDPVGPEDDVVFAGTGTGEAPHNVMAAELLMRGHTGRIAVVTCVRFRADLAYEATHRELERRYSNYRYLTLTTREPENLDPARPNYVGKQYLQRLFETDAFEKQAGWAPDPSRTHVFICGNPSMIGVPVRDAAGNRVFPQPPGLVEVLTRAGFRLDEPRNPGNIHVEKYW